MGPWLIAGTRLWTARHQSYFAALQMRPGCRCQSTDTCVPISRLCEQGLLAVEVCSHSGVLGALAGKHKHNLGGVRPATSGRLACGRIKEPKGIVSVVAGETMP